MWAFATCSSRGVPRLLPGVPQTAVAGRCPCLHPAPGTPSLQGWLGGFPAVSGERVQGSPSTGHILDVGPRYIQGSRVPGNPCQPLLENATGRSGLPEVTPSCVPMRGGPMAGLCRPIWTESGQSWCGRGGAVSPSLPLPVTGHCWGPEACGRARVAGRPGVDARPPILSQHRWGGRWPRAVGGRVWAPLPTFRLLSQHRGSWRKGGPVCPLTPVNLGRRARAWRPRRLLLHALLTPSKLGPGGLSLPLSSVDTCPAHAGPRWAKPVPTDLVLLPVRETPRMLPKPGPV